jgi:hypothetical protein
MAPLRDGGRRIILGHAHDVRETASLWAADPLSVFRIVDALDPPSREVDFDQLVAAAVERVRRRFSSRGRNQGNKYARVAYAWLKHRKWQAVGIPRRTFFHALKKVKDFFYAQKIRVKCAFSSVSPAVMLHSERNFCAVSGNHAWCTVKTKRIHMKTHNPDLRGTVKFPPRPHSTEEIHCSPAEPWLLACSLVGKYDRWQVNTYRKFYELISDDIFYREIIDATRIIFDESRNIMVPSAFLAAQFKLAAAGKEIYR